MKAINSRNAGQYNWGCHEVAGTGAAAGGPAQVPAAAGNTATGTQALGGKLTNSRDSMDTNSSKNIRESNRSTAGKT